MLYSTNTIEEPVKMNKLKGFYPKNLILRILAIIARILLTCILFTCILFTGCTKVDGYYLKTLAEEVIVDYLSCGNTESYADFLKKHQKTFSNEIYSKLQQYPENVSKSEIDGYRDNEVIILNTEIYDALQLIEDYKNISPAGGIIDVSNLKQLNLEDSSRGDYICLVEVKSLFQGRIEIKYTIDLVFSMESHNIVYFNLHLKI